MISKLATIQGIDHTVIMPMVTQITSDLNKKIIKDKDVFINNMFMYEKENADFADNNYSNALGGPNIDISLDVEDIDVFNKTSSMYKPINKIIVLDKDTGLNIRQIYLSTKLNLTYGYRTQSKEKINSVLNRLKLYYTNTGYNIIHDLPYSYTMPLNVIDLIKNINYLKNNNNDYLTYFNSIIRYKFDLAINRSKTYKIPVFRGIQSNVIGMFSDEPKSISISKGSTPEYGITFNYSVLIQKPMGLYIQYPIMVNNKKLEDKWLGVEEYAKPLLTPDGVLNINGIVNRYIDDDTKYSDVSMIKLPSYDRFVPLPNFNDKSRVKLVSMLLEVDPTNKFNIFNIDDLKYIGLPKLMIDYLKNKGDDIFKFGESIFYIELYEKDYIKDYGLHQDTTNNILTTKELKTDTSYHILISMLVDLNYINYEPNSTRLEEDITLLKHFKLEYLMKKTKTSANLNTNKFTS